MLLLLLLFRLVQGPFTQGFPLSGSLPVGLEDSLQVRSLHDTTLSCTCPNPDQRSVWDILWSCLAVIFACSWVSVHPDIPAPGESQMRTTFRRLEYMVWTLLAPELIVFWAGRQFLGARYIAKTLEQRGWTKVHGHFLQMGGFMLVDGKTSKGVLSYTQFWRLLYKNRIQLPEITEEDINDRGKSDGLGKLLVIAQTGWFILQCTSRRVQGLDLTELELATLAFAALNGCMYFFWWNKPFDVRVPVRVPLLLPSPTFSDKDLELHKGNRPNEPQESVNANDGLIGNSGATTFSNEMVEQSNTPQHHFGFHYILNAPSKIYQLICRRMRALLLLYISAERDINGAHATLEPIDTSYLRQVPAFHAFMLDSDDHTDGFLIFGLPFISSAFGAIHCAAWFFHFPSEVEHLIWRISSLCIASIPLIDLALLLIISNIPGQRGVSRFFRTLLQSIMIYFSLPVYFAARVALLIEALTTLRELPPGAFAVVRWTTFIPHIS